MKKNKVQSSYVTTKNIKDFQNLAFNFLEERKIDYAGGVAIIGTILMAAFQHACTQLKMSAEKTKEAFDAMLDEMKTQQDKCSDDLFEEGDNETTDAN